ncbi:hypothetical protein ACLI79_004722, partial [Salmonella enterica subsp. enterica serovar Montevideo]
DDKFITTDYLQQCPAIYQGVRLGQSAIPFAWPEMPRANNVSGRYQMDFVGGGLHQTLQRSVVR